MTSLCHLSIDDLALGLAHKRFSSAELTASYLQAIRDTEPSLGAFLKVCEERATEDARLSDQRRSRGETLSPLDGLPIALKDIFLTEGIETTCASRILQGYIPPYESTVSARLKNAGCVLLGKLNMDEFAMGSSNENSAFGPCRNPWDLERVSGGSSGGSAAAVAARLAPGTFGTDTGGSIRQPAAFCGVSGLKPTYGRVSRYGIIAFASSLDQAGPIAADVSGLAALLAVIAGHDPKDSTSSLSPLPDLQAALQTAPSALQGLRLGLPKEYFLDGIEADTSARLHEAIAFFRSQGAEIVDISLPHTSYAVAAYYILATAEASSNLARFDGIRFGHRSSLSPNESLLDLYERSRAEGFGSEVKRRILLGTYALQSGYYDAYYRKAQEVRHLIQRDFLHAFGSCDLLLTPTSPSPAFRLGERLHDPLHMYLADIFTLSCNLAGLPGLSIPCGFTSQRLPVGLQLLAPPFREDLLLSVGHAYQLHTSWHLQRPPFPSTHPPLPTATSGDPR